LDVPSSRVVLWIELVGVVVVNVEDRYEIRSWVCCGE
jgi:hypothetical protein